LGNGICMIVAWPVDAWAVQVSLKRCLFLVPSKVDSLWPSEVDNARPGSRKAQPLTGGENVSS
jgi:hypothetical protein